MERETSFQRYLLTLRILFSLVVCATIAFYVDKSIHWQVMWDTSIMHYVNFLMAHGLSPYRDIVDINLPASYFMEGLAMHIFGGGDLGWRLYDYTLLLILIASLLVIAWPEDWFAGLIAGTMFLLIHASSGPLDAGQREQLMITLIVAGYALLFTSTRYQKPVLLLPFGLLLGIAPSLKPTSAPLGVLLLLMAAISLRKRNVKIAPYLTYGLFGILLGSLTSLMFLYEYHAFGAFVAISRRLVPYYASVGNISTIPLAHTLFRTRYCLLIATGIAFLLVNKAERQWENWERLTIGLGIVFGILSYLAQGKPYEAHAYPFLMFVLLGSSLEFCKAWKKRGWTHVVGLACILLLLGTKAPALVRMISTPEPVGAEQDALQADLTRLGGSHLEYQVQCFDMVSSCFSTLYHMRLMPYSTFMGDYMFFGPRSSPPLPFYRTMMWNKLQASPPKVVVLTNQWMSEDFSFNKVNQWPQLAAFLNSRYIQQPTRTFGKFAYKIYVLQ